MRIRNISLDGLNLMSSDYVFVLTGLFDIEKNIISNDLYTDGKSFSRSKNAEKKPLLNGFIKTSDVAKITALNRVLAANKEKKLIVEIEDLGEVYLYVEIENRITGDKSTRKISCQLVASDPSLYSNTPNTVSLGATSNASMQFPLTFPIVFGAIIGATGVITNDGNVVGYPVISVVGTCDNITVTNETTGESMSCNVSLGADDVLVIDSRPSVRGIYLNGTKRMDLKNGDWFTCEPGDNTFSFSRNSSESKQHCTVEMESRWM